jgi:polysaccharide biosynthesis/export protein
MRLLFIALVISAVAVSGPLQQGSHAPGSEAGSNLPARPIGPNDLIMIFVYGAPELSRTIRVGTDGMIRLPMVKQHIKAEGAYPADLETLISTALADEHILIDAFVTVTISEYKSHPISVSGAVKQPLVFQASAPVTLLEALAEAEGLREDAGNEVLVTRTQIDSAGKTTQVTQHIPARALSDASDPSLNVTLSGGENVLVPIAPKIYVIGNVRKSGAYPVQNSDETTVLQMLALAEGLSAFATKEAYIYRREPSGARNEIPVPLSKIMQRKSPDVTLVANDIFYIPDNKGKRLAAETVEHLAAAGTVLTGALAVR